MPHGLPLPRRRSPDLCHAASVRRSHHDHRLAGVGRTAGELAAQLEAFIRGETSPTLVAGHKATRQSGVVFVFPGQGGQWLGMGRQLLEQAPVFRQALERCEQAFRPYVDWSLLEQLTADEARSRLNDVNVVQPLLFAIQVALADLWRAWGVQPEAVVGHSLGEVAAAYVAGALSLEDAARIICTRSRLMRRASGRGAMAVVELSILEAQAALVGYEGRLSIAVSNSPRSTVISGDPAALEEVVVALQNRNVFCRPVKVDVAAHSTQMEPFRSDLVEALAGIRPQATAIALYSTVTGETISGQSLQAAYWGRNLREPVLFSAATQRLMADGYTTFIELSPHPVLLPAIEQNDAAPVFTVASLRRGEDEMTAMLSALGKLYTGGYDPDWQRLYPVGQHLTLPAYPWQHERFWFEAVPAEAKLRPGVTLGAKASHPLLGWRVDLAGASQRVWQVELDAQKLPHAYAHRLNGTAMLAASTSLEMALAVAQVAFEGQPTHLSELAFQQALPLRSEGRPTTLQITLGPSPSGAATFGIYSRPAEAWQLHVTGAIQPGPAQLPAVPALETIQSRCAQQLTGPAFYAALEHQGVQIGAPLQGVTQLWQGPGEVLAQLQAAKGAGNLFALAGLDAGFQLLGLVAPSSNQGFHIPVRVEHVRVTPSPVDPVWAHARLRPAAAGDLPVVDLVWLDEAGRVVIELAGVHLKPLGQQARTLSENLEDWLYALNWQAAAPLEGAVRQPPLTGSWLILADHAGVGAALATQLELSGQRCLLATASETAARLTETRWTIRPDQPADLQAVIGQSERDELRGIVHLWSLDAALPEALNAAALETAQTLGCGAALHVVQTLAQVEWPQPPRVWLVTRGAQAVTAGQAVAVAQAPLWGLGRVIAEEHREFWGGLIDLDPASGAEASAAQLYDQINRPDGEDQLAYRRNQRYAARLARLSCPPPAFRQPRWRPDAAYLITGGLGGIGLQVARWMAKQGARRLILMGRTQLPPRATWAQPQRFTLGAPHARRSRAGSLGRERALRRGGRERRSRTDRFPGRIPARRLAADRRCHPHRRRDRGSPAAATGRRGPAGCDAAQGHRGLAAPSGAVATAARDVRAVLVGGRLAGSGGPRQLRRR